MSIAYAYLSYYTAYLKANYPVEMYAAAISCETDPETQSLYINDAKGRGIKILSPQLNASSMDFIVSNGTILYGFKGLKGVGEKAIEQLLIHRPYTSASDFLRKIVDNKLKIPKQVIEALIKIGAFDCFGVNRRVLLDSYDRFLTDYKTFSKGKSKFSENDTLRFNDKFYFPSSDSTIELSLFDILSFEKKYMGIYLSGNPYDSIKSLFGSLNLISVSDLDSNNGKGNIFVEILGIKETVIKSNKKKMAILKCIDKSNSIFEVPLFPEIYDKYKDILDEGSFLILSVRKNDRGLLCLSITNINDKVSEKLNEQKTENIVTSAYVKVYDHVSIKKIYTRLEKLKDENEDSFRDLRVYLTIGGYVFKVGSIKYPCSIEGIRQLNSIENIEVIVNR